MRGGNEWEGKRVGETLIGEGRGREMEGKGEGGRWREGVTGESRREGRRESRKWEWEGRDGVRWRREGRKCLSLL